LDDSQDDIDTMHVFGSGCGCGLCVPACPEDAIILAPQNRYTDYFKSIDSGTLVSPVLRLGTVTVPHNQ